MAVTLPLIVPGPKFRLGIETMARLANSFHDIPTTTEVSGGITTPSRFSEVANSSPEKAEIEQNRPNKIGLIRFITFDYFFTTSIIRIRVGKTCYLSNN